MSLDHSGIRFHHYAPTRPLTSSDSALPIVPKVDKYISCIFTITGSPINVDHRHEKVMKMTCHLDTLTYAPFATNQYNQYNPILLDGDSCHINKMLYPETISAHHGRHVLPRADKGWKQHDCSKSNLTVISKQKSKTAGKCGQVNNPLRLFCYVLC